MKNYLIRRNSVFTEFRNIQRIKSPKKGYSETVITKQERYPKSVQLKIGDTVYVSETGVGVFAKGIVVDGVVQNPGKEIITCHSLDQIIEQYDIENQSSYWTEKLAKFHKRNKKGDNYKFRFHRYYIDQNLLTTTIPFEGPLKRYVKRGYAWSFTELEEKEVEFIEDPIIPPDTELRLDMPSKLKFELHALFNKKASINHWIDIDHLVPKSVGGPGNIKENLVPIGLSLNRYKSNSIPVEFFEVAENKLNWELPSDIKSIISQEDGLINLGNNSTLIDEAKKINTEVWKSGIKLAREFYGDIMKANYPEYYRVITSE